MSEAAETYTVIEAMLGKVMESVVGVPSSASMVFLGVDGTRYVFEHHQDCCEQVEIEDIIGELDDLVGWPLLMAEQASRNDPGASESGTWTFYKFATAKGYVTVRWLGTSNGYYSESVDFSVHEAPPQLATSTDRQSDAALDGKRFAPRTAVALLDFDD